MSPSLSKTKVCEATSTFPVARVISTPTWKVPQPVREIKKGGSLQSISGGEKVGCSFLVTVSLEEKGFGKPEYRSDTFA